MAFFKQITDELELVKRIRKENSHEEYKYLHLLEDIIENGVRASNRTGIETLTIPSASLSFDLSQGFPLLTTKKMAWKTMKVELEGFIKGVTTKKWYQERGCSIWDEWCNPQKVPYAHDSETLAKMKMEDDLGEIYGFQWRSFDGDKNQDQLKSIISTLKVNPSDRRMVCSAWNPKALHKQALPPCHIGFIVNCLDGVVNLSFQMRSVDIPLGLPFNVSSYALLLHLICMETGLKEGILTAFLTSPHIYVNQIEGAKEQLKRVPYQFPTVHTDNFVDIFSWEASQTKLVNYTSHPKIDMPIAI
jgi:thymidylate synthase